MLGDKTSKTLGQLGKSRVEIGLKGGGADQIERLKNDRTGLMPKGFEPRPCKMPSLVDR